MSELAEPFAITTNRRAGDAPAWEPEPRPAGYVAYAPTRASAPDRFFFALAVLHAIRCATAAATLISATRANDVFSIALLPLLLTGSHAALTIGCYRQRAWAKLGSILLDVQASFITIVALLAVSNYEFTASNFAEQIVVPGIGIWLALNARVNRRKR